MTTDETNEHHEDAQDSTRRPSSTSPLEGKTHEATKPPGQGDVDREAVEKSREALDRAAGGH
jgi:hypothetical protein